MHTHSLSDWTHPHDFLGVKHVENERRTWFVVALTTAMMFAEIIGGTWYGSMALVADGWHMSTHAGAHTARAAPITAMLPMASLREHSQTDWLWFGIRQGDRNIYLPCLGWIALDGAVIAGAVVYG